MRELSRHLEELRKLSIHIEELQSLKLLPNLFLRIDFRKPFSYFTLPVLLLLLYSEVNGNQFTAQEFKYTKVRTADQK